jgi:hypothetical protein
MNALSANDDVTTLDDLVARFEADETSNMLGRGMEIASGTIDGGLRCLLPACDLDEFWRRVRKVTSVVTECDLPEAPLRDAAPRRIG